MLRKLHHLPLRNSPDQIQMQPTLPLLGLRISHGPRESIGDQGESGEASATNHKQQFPVGEQFFQRSTPCTFRYGNVC
jgi:hypothetical protein